MAPRFAPRSTGNTPIGGPGRDIRHVNPGIDPSRIADIYRQRIPTGPVPSARTTAPVRPTGPTVATTRISDRVGPGGTTIADVQRVAQGGTPTRPATQWPAPPSAPAPLDVRKVYESLIGGPASTYGEKYGGMPSASYFADLVRGETYNSILASQMAAEEAARLAQPVEERYAYDIDPTRGGIAGKQVQENRRIMSQPVTDYASHMARMNAARGASEGGALANAQAMVTPRLQAQRKRALEESGAARRMELANLIGGLTPSEIMQQIAIERYGYDPGLAAGLFSATEDLSYENMLIDAENARMMREEGVDVNATTAEIILAQYGPEGLRQYQDQQGEYAMNGTPTQQLSAEKNLIDAENAMFDEKVREDYGFDPTKVTGVAPDDVRDRTMDRDWTDAYETAREQIIDGGDALEIASTIADDYRKATNDTIGATALQEILASFDLASFG